ncbi:dTDP-4-dehydrorhamnose reductase [Bradyrhizobium lablabi]|uniref:dTDP-4-dehydrorhamnose reductase n=1 Tax=Bradyrhizobium lablabi TaxID=722472 RepID=UPI001BAAFC00|nr:dTDP-4-dehydrorhamnose reductase [Bradyrhizobium lablabi]
MKVLVTGREGQLARSLFELQGEDVRVVTIGRPDIDLADARSVETVISREQPDVVVNAAAYTAVDKAEAEEASANAVNAQGAENVARSCAGLSIPLIHLSTDYVFDGAKAGAYLEEDATAPINAYGRSKLNGERRVVVACERHVILRTAWVHSPWGANFVKAMLRLAAEQGVVRVVDDQRGSPTYAPHLASLVLALARRIATDAAGIPWGIYHAAGAGETSRLDLAGEIFRAASQQGLPAAGIVAIKTADFLTAARRPANSVLNCEKLRRVFGLELPDWRLGVREAVSRLSAGQHGRH